MRGKDSLKAPEPLQRIELRVIKFNGSVPSREHKSIVTRDTIQESVNRLAKQFKGVPNAECIFKIAGFPQELVWETDDRGIVRHFL